MTFSDVSFLDGKCLDFLSVTFGEMKYVYPDAGHWTAGWLLRRTAGGQWITERKATSADVKEITGAVVRAHHSQT